MAATVRDEVQELRLALVALTSSLAERCPHRCAEALDEATRKANRAPRSLLRLLGAPAERMISVRFDAARAIDGACGSCRACERGARSVERVMAETPPGPTTG